MEQRRKSRFGEREWGPLGYVKDEIIWKHQERCPVIVVHAELELRSQRWTRIKI